MKKILNALFLTMITLVTFSCSDVPAPYDINEGGGSSALEGEGTKDNPYTVADAISKQDGSEAWVKGYIVGIMGNKYKPDGVTFDGNIPVFVAPFTIDTNVLIAATAGETNIKKCLPVKVKGGSDLAKAINLKDHPDNLGKPLIIKGKLAAGFGTAALIETTAAVFDGKDIGDAGGGKPEGAYIYETFSTSLGGFKSVSVSGTLEWHNDFSSAMVKGGSATEKFPSQTWLVAPTIDLTTETAAYISFDHAINYADAATIKEYHQLMISKDYTTDVAAATWTSLNITMASGNSFTFINSGKVSIPAEYLGQSKVTVALKYTSTETTGSTWEVQKFTVAHGEGGSIVDPIEPEVPSTGLGSKDEPYDVATVLTKQDDTKAWIKGFIVGGVIVDNAGNTVDVASDVVFGTEGVRNSAILIAASKDEKDFKKCLVIGFGSDSNTAKTALNLVDNKDKLGKEVKLCGTFKNAFSAPGMKTIIDFVLVEGGGVDPTPTTNLVANPGFEVWNEATLGSWSAYGIFAKETSVKHGGDYSFKHTSAKNSSDLKQDVAVEAGKKYRISYWYLDNDANAKTRIWSNWASDLGKITDAASTATLQPSAYSVDNAEWKQFTATLTAPDTATKLTFMVRTYNDNAGGGFIYYDDFEVIEVE